MRSRSIDQTLLGEVNDGTPDTHGIEVLEEIYALDPSGRMNKVDGLSAKFLTLNALT